MQTLDGYRPRSPVRWPCLGAGTRCLAGPRNAQGAPQPPYGWWLPLRPVLSVWSRPSSDGARMRRWRHPDATFDDAEPHAVTAAFVQHNRCHYRELPADKRWRWWVAIPGQDLPSGYASTRREAMRAADAALWAALRSHDDLGDQPERLCLISCCGPKLDHAAPARDLYTSDLFRKSVRWAEAQRLPWAVLSALHGLVWPDDVVEPYDLRIQSLDASERAVWVADVVAELGEASPAAVAVVLAGAAYADPLAPALEALGWTVEQPLRGKQIGERKRWLRGEILSSSKAPSVAPAQTQMFARRAS